ncbi:unnamed protein product [Cladocopium goreaui]|uniref:Uncharacterized protein n=1 Tax=Cladocopium goreaui TaxID=2562237 RepID=A0A9P1FY48_9DINO|nr:unnamed protein product [Cladocopium goreaui]
MDEGPLDEFQGLKGHLLVEAVFGKYGAGTATIPWLLNGKERAIKPDSTNRPIMESLAEAYADRILTSGLNVDCSGRAWMVFGQNNSLPVHAITFNHRSEAMYRALTRDPESPYVKKALSTGLESVRMLRPDTPDSVRRMLCSMHNQYHEGTGETWLALLDKAEELMEAWDAKNNGPGGSGLTTRHKEYDTCLERFLFKEKQATAWGGSLNFFKSTTILNNYLTKFAVKDEVRRFCNERMNFADFKLVNRPGQNGGLGLW